MYTLLELQNVRHNYNGKVILDIEELAFVRGSITGLAGPNGSGKTTLLKLLARIEQPAAGSVLYKGRNTAAAEKSFRRNISLLPQDAYLLRRSVFENLAYGLRIRKKNEDLAANVTRALHLVGLPGSFASRQWHELSGGEAQRVALAARLILRPDCLLLDEPTASVDMESARNIRRAVLNAREEWGTTLVIASHHIAWLKDICDRIINLYNGRMIDCSYENILTGPWEVIDNRMVACRLADGQKIYAIRPPQESHHAVIPPQMLRIKDHGRVPGEETVEGIIASLSLENESVGPQMHVTCGDQRLAVSMTADMQGSGRYLPGCRVKLFYSPGDIVWLKTS